MNFNFPPATGKRMRSGFLVLACLLQLVMSAAVVAQDATPPGMPELSITMAPGGMKDGNPTWVDVKLRISGVEWKQGEPFLRVPVKFAGVPSVPYSEGDLNATDENGPIPLRQTVDEPDEGGFLYFRRWSPQRNTTGVVNLEYRAEIELYIPELGAGPPFDLRAQGGGISGATNTFLVHPDSEAIFMTRIAWDLSALAPGSIGVTSLGDGDTASPGPMDRLIATFVMAGPIGRYPEQADESNFTGYWIGEPKFDAKAVLAWSEKAYRAIVDFFDDDDPPNYRVLMRGNPYPGGGGAALISSFLVSYPDTKTDGDDLRETIAHETVHNWVSGIGGPPGSSSWYSEGMTVTYTRRLLLRSGLFTPEEFLESVNNTATSYYTNALNNTPNDEIAAGFWRDTRIRSLPYTRGSLYFASVDTAIREKSGGKRSLDDLLRAFVARQQGGEAVTGDTWRELVTAELGEAGAQALDAMLAGELIVPPSDAFGPCFQREEAQLRSFDLGFDRKSLYADPRIVGGLEAGSAAAQAGLRDGDIILHPVPLEEAQADPEKTLDLQVRRGQDEITIEYLPRGEAVQGWQWVRVPDVPDARCAERGRYEAVLRPVLGSDGEVAAIEVDSVIHGGLAEDAERLSLAAPIVFSGAYGIADRVKGLTVTDAGGAVELEVSDDEANAGGFPYFRHWIAQRDVEFPVRVQYRAEVEVDTPHRGPPFNIKPSKGGVSGAGFGFLVIPENSNAETSGLSWDLGGFATGASGLSSFGEGGIELDGPPSGLLPAWYMAGPVGRFPHTGDVEGFSAAWLGDFPFNPAEEMALVAKGYAWLGAFFGYLSPPPRYRVFMRIVPYPIPRFSGTALGQSFMLSGPPNGLEESDGEPPRGTFFHEMIHMWVGQVEGPQGVTSWFSEGLTSYYTMVLPLQGGFETLVEYRESVERLPERYYTSPGLGMSAEAITEVGFTNNDIREMPYIRGNLYFADLNARIRTASGGERGLDDLVREIFDRREFDDGYTFDHDAWIAEISAELGAEAGAEFQARIIEGETFAAVSGAFGPCFEREPAAYETESGVVDGYRWVRREDVAEEQCANF
jgi:predicted metalloprotease with PDZ domain